MGRTDISTDKEAFIIDVSKNSKFIIGSAITNSTYGRIAIYGDSTLLERNESYSNKEFDISTYNQLTIKLGSANSSVTSIVATLSNLEIK